MLRFWIRFGGQIGFANGLDLGCRWVVGGNGEDGPGGQSSRGFLSLERSPGEVTSIPSPGGKTTAGPTGKIVQI